MMPTRRSPPRVLSAFTGAGGLDLGFEAAGYEVIGCIEIDERCRETIAANRPGWRVLDPGDITELAQGMRPEHLGLGKGELEVLTAGPPCQPFSKAAQWTENGRAGLSDSRSACINSLLDLVELLLPRCIMLENVAGFLRGQTSAKALIEQRLAEINERHGTSYTLTSQVVDAADFGVPQHRVRAIGIILREGEGFEWPDPSHREQRLRAWDALADVEGDDVPALVGKWAGLLSSIPEGRNYQWHTDRGGGEPLFGYRTRYWSFLLKLAKSEPSWTIPAQPGPATGPFHWHSRPLSVKEVLRLQTFPADWNVKGDYSEQFHQVGNATPPLLAEVFARALGRQLFELTFAGDLVHAIRLRSDLPAPERTQPVPHEYLHLAGEHAPHPGTGLGPRPVKPQVPEEPDGQLLTEVAGGANALELM